MQGSTEADQIESTPIPKALRYLALAAAGIRLVTLAGLYYQLVVLNGAEIEESTQVSATTFRSGYAIGGFTAVAATIAHIRGLISLERSFIVRTALLMVGSVVIFGLIRVGFNQPLLSPFELVALLVSLLILRFSIAS